MKLKKILSAFIAGAMLLSTVPAAVMANADPIIYQSEFNGTDDAKNTGTWARYQVFDYNQAWSGAPANGVMNSNTSNAGSGAFGLYFPEAIAVTGKKIIVETRFRSGAKQTLSKPILAIDRVTNSTGEESTAFRIGASQNKLAWTDNSHNEQFVHDGVNFPVVAEKWYELKCEFDYTMTTATKPVVNFTIEDEDGNSHTVEGARVYYDQTRDIKGIITMQTAQNYSENYDWNIDYIRVYDADAVTPVTATYNGAALGEEEVAIENAEVTLSFASDITEADMAGITINNDAVLSPTLSDSKTVTLAISGLEGGRNYKLTVPMIGANGGKTFSFTTADDGSGVASLEAFYGETALDGATGVTMPEAEVTLSLGKAVTADADLTGIAVDNGATAQAVLGEDGKTVTLTLTGLKPRSSHTLTVPALGENPAGSFTFRTVDDPMYIARAEFDGNDDTSLWVYYNASDDESAYTKEPSGGVLRIDMMKVGSGSFALKLPTGTVTKGKKLILESRFMEAGNTAITSPTFLAARFGEAVAGQTKATRLAASGGKLAYYGNDPNNIAVTTDYAIANKTWYTVRTEIDYTGTSPVVKHHITDGTNSYSSSDTKTTYGSDNNLVAVMTNSTSGGNDWDIDYIRVYDAALLPKITAEYAGAALEGAKGVKNGTVTLKFEEAITEAELTGKTATIDNGATVSALTYVDANTASLTLSNVAKRTSYILTIPTIGLNMGGSFSFYSADEAKYIARAEFDGKDDTSLWAKYKADGEYKEKWTESPSNGVMSVTTDNSNSGAFGLRLPDGIVTENKRIIVETKFRSGQRTNPVSKNIFSLRDGGAYSNYRTVTLGTPGGYFAYYGYDPNASDPTKTEFAINAEQWYTLKCEFDFTSGTPVANYYIEGNGTNYEVSGASVAYGRKINIKDVVTMQTGANGDPSEKYAWEIDYVRVWDADYGKAEVTYGDDVKLDNSVLVPVSGSFSVTAGDEVSDASGITLATEGGTSVEVGTVAEGSTITITYPELAYNTKYVLTIPKAVLGIEEDQVISFTTIYDNTKTFDTAAATAALGENPSIVFLGGSITEQAGPDLSKEAGYAHYVKEMLEDVLTDATFKNVGIGGTGAQYGWTRLDKDVISKDPDMVFIEFAVNDAKNAKAGDWLESIVRNLNTLEKPPVIVLIETTEVNFNDNNLSIAEHAKIAKAYGIPVINVRDYMRTKYNEDASFANAWDTTNTYLQDGTHPQPAGSKMYGEYINALLTYHTAEYFKAPKANSEVLKQTEGCKEYYYGYTAINEEIEAEKTITFKGTEAVLEVGRLENGGTFSVTIDGIELTTDEDSADAPGKIVITETYAGLTDGEHTMVITPEEGKKVKVQGIYTKKVTPVATFTAPEFDAGTVTTGTLLTAKATYKANTETPYVFVIALYDNDGRLTSITKATTVMTDDADIEREISVSVTPKTGETTAALPKTAIRAGRYILSLSGTDISVQMFSAV